MPYQTKHVPRPPSRATATRHEPKPHEFGVDAYFEALRSAPSDLPVKNAAQSSKRAPARRRSRSQANAPSSREGTSSLFAPSPVIEGEDLMARIARRQRENELAGEQMMLFIRVVFAALLVGTILHVIL